MKGPSPDGPEPAEDAEAARRLAERYGLEWIDTLEESWLDPDLIHGVPVDWARARVLLPICRAGEICLLTADPSQVAAQEEMSLLLGRDLRPVVAPKPVILRGIEACFFRREPSPQQFFSTLEPPRESRTEARPVAGGDDLLAASASAPVTHLVNLLLLEAVRQRASDVHIEPFESRLRVRYRVDGFLYDQPSPPKSLEQALISRLKVMARMDIAERRLPQDGMARVRVGEREIDIRVSTVPVAEGERVVLRLLDRDSALLPLEALGMPPPVLARFQRVMEHPYGMLVVSGPTGSGKTTTLYAALTRLDAVRRNILTIEDPIEYRLDNIGQIQVKPKIGLTFAVGLRHILRQDPDVILVGETRDRETADIAVRAALTGHRVLTTLHTNDAPSAVLRLADLGVEPYLLASCIDAVLAQRLVRRLCVSCRVEQAVPPDLLARLGPRGEEWAEQRGWAPRGCPACLDGYRGRTGLFEFMEMTPAVRERVHAGRFRAEELRALAVSEGMRPLLEVGLDRVREGVTSLPEVLAVAGS